MGGDGRDVILTIEGSVEEPEDAVPAHAEEVAAPFTDEVVHHDLCTLGHVRPLRSAWLRRITACG